MNKKILLTGIVLLILVSLSAIHIEIGVNDGANVFVPVTGLWNYNWSRTVYLQTEIGQPLEITGISYYIASGPENYQMVDQKIYLRHTLDDVVSSPNYIDPTNNAAYQLVFDGDITYTGVGWNQIEFDTSFNYDGAHNLEVMVQNRDGNSTTGFPRFAKTDSPNVNRSASKAHDVYFPEEFGAFRQLYPYTRFHFEEAGAPTSATLDFPLISSMNVSMPVTLEWTSGENTETFDVYLSEDFNLVVESDPTTLIAEDITATSLLVEDLENLTTYHWRVASSNTISDHISLSDVFNFTTQAADGLIVIGNGTLENQCLPMEPAWRRTISQTIYPQEWLNISDQRIEAISYYFNGNSAWSEENIQIFMAHTDQDEFATTTSWIPHTDLELVYDGSFAVQAIEGWVEIALDTPFEYNNTQNLVIAFSEQNEPRATSDDDFYCTALAKNLSIEKTTDATINDFITPPIGRLRSSYPNTLFTFGDIPSGEQLFVAPSSYTWETTIMGFEGTPVTFTLRNSGLGTLTVNSVTIEEQNHFSIVDENEYPVSLTDNSIQFVANFHPIAAGDFNTNIIVTDSYGNETTIPLSGSSYDATITYFPHLEGFELVDNYEIPADWSTIISSTAEAYINVHTFNPYEGSKALRFYIGDDANPDHIKAITPPIQDVNSKRVSFYARGSTSNLTLGVGTTSSNTNPEVYNQLAEFNLTNRYQRFEVDLSTADDGDSMICFNFLANNATYKTVFFDDLTIEQIPDGPFAEFSPTLLNFGNVYLNEIGEAQINVQNRGLGDLVADFSSESGLFTFEEEQVTVAPGTTETVVVNLHPVAEGDFNSSFIIETNADNAPSTTITAIANILPALPEGLVEIGEGTVVNQGLPFEPFYRHSYSQSIYYADEIDMSNQRIEKISWHYNGHEAWGPDQLRIFMGTTTNSEFSGNTDWIDIEDLTEVFDGTIQVTGGESWVQTELDVPYAYDNSLNLVVAVFFSAVESHSNNSEFYCTATPLTRSIIYYNDTNIPDPADPPTARYMRNYIPNVQLQFGELPTDADLVVFPTVNIFEMVALDETSLEKTITMRSTGLGDAIIATPPTITGADADQFTISTDLNDYPLTLPFLDTATLGVSFTPTSEGSKSATLEIIDNATRLTRVVSLHGYGYQVSPGNDEPAGATILTLPVEGVTYAIMPVGDIDWYKIPAMGIGDTLLIRTEIPDGYNISVKSWLYGPITDPSNIAGDSFIASGTNIEHELPETGDYYLRVAKSTNSPSQEAQRDNFADEDSRFIRNDTGLYNLFVDANYNYDYNAPINLEAHNRSGFIELNWIEPEFERYLVSYKVYRDNEQINSEPILIGTNTFSDSNVLVGTEYTYHVVAVYEDPSGESIPSNRVTIIYFDEDEPIWADSFEGHPDFTLDLPNWIQHDVDGASTYGISNVEYENAGEPMSYMVFNPSATTPPITNMEPYDGEKFLAAFASSVGANDDWIITPPITIGTQTVLSFYARSYTSEHSLEKFRVKMSFTGSEPADFQYSVHQGVDHLEAPIEWTSFYFNLSQLSGNTARFAIQCISEDAFVFMVDKFRIDGTEDTVDNQDSNVAPVVTNLEQNYPNPFNPETTISFSLQEAGDVTLDIYNLRGQKVRTLVNEHRESGKHSVVWNGTDDNNKSVSSGVYFYKMKSGKSSISKKMILMK